MVQFMPSHRRLARLFAAVAVVGPLGALSAADADADRKARAQRAAILERIAVCESGGNPRAVSRNGLYRGKYQFSRETWRSLGGKGDPAKARERTQDRLADKLLRRAGTTPWPNCASRV